MGNTNSTSTNTPSPQARLSESPSRRNNSPSRRGSPVSPAASNRVHRSLRTKKKSLELPDLASLVITPASSSPNSRSPHSNYRRPRPSSPIPIPIAGGPPQQVFRPQNNLPSAAHIGGSTTHMSDGPSRAYPYRPRNRSYLSSAYPSSSALSARNGPGGSPILEEPLRPEFVPEIVHSTIPLALVKAEGDVKPEPVPVKIHWRGGGNVVVLARAGDDNWQGRQPMEYDAANKQWVAIVHLMPGTHHLKFIVDDQWRISDDYPTAADDRDGSLANYVAVPFPVTSSSATPPSTQVHSNSNSGPTSPISSPQHHANQQSFWNDGSAQVETGWTTVIPPELIAAAAEEEAYLANADTPSQSSGYSNSVPAPNIPPAPVLPRHLDKLILNVRPQAVGAPASFPGPGSDRERSKRGRGSRRHIERDRDSRDGRVRPTSHLGMTSSGAPSGSPTLAPADTNAGTGPNGLSIALPVVTASGTDVTYLSHAGETVPPGPTTPPLPAPRLDAPGLADDASVLPVPSHVVLHHLSTSAIRNGVLAVASTTRYRKKYITTIYYKPT